VLEEQSFKTDYMVAWRGLVGKPIGMEKLLTKIHEHGIEQRCQSIVMRRVNNNKHQSHNN